MDDKNNVKKIINVTTKYFWYVFIAIFVIVLLVGYLLLIRPLQQKIAVSAANLQSAEAAYAYLESDFNNFQKFTEHYQQIKLDNPSEINQINMILPMEKNHAEIISQIEYLVLKNGLLISSINIIPSSEEVAKSSKGATSTSIVLPQPKIGKIEVNLELIGVDYKAMKNILSVFENNLRLLDINSLDFSPNTKTLNLKLTAYYLAQ